MSIEKEGSSGLMFADNDIKIGDVVSGNLDPDFAALLATTTCSYKDMVLQEHLFSEDDLQAILEDLMNPAAQFQVSDILAFMRDRELSYIRFN